MSGIVKQVSTMKSVIVTIMFFLPLLFWGVQSVKMRAMCLRNGMTIQGRCDGNATPNNVTPNNKI